jgi:hypothetical protein
MNGMHNISFGFSYRYKVRTGFFSSPWLLRIFSNSDSRDSHEGIFSVSTSEEDASEEEDDATGASPPRKDAKAGRDAEVARVGVDGDRATNP